MNNTELIKFVSNYIEEKLGKNPKTVSLVKEAFAKFLKNHKEKQLANNKAKPVVKKKTKSKTVSSPKKKKVISKPSTPVVAKVESKKPVALAPVNKVAPKIKKVTSKPKPKTKTISKAKVISKPKAKVISKPKAKVISKPKAKKIITKKQITKAKPISKVKVAKKPVVKSKASKVKKPVANKVTKSSVSTKTTKLAKSKSKKDSKQSGAFMVPVDQSQSKALTIIDFLNRKKSHNDTAKRNETTFEMKANIHERLKTLKLRNQSKWEQTSEMIAKTKRDLHIDQPNSSFTNSSPLNLTKELTVETNLQGLTKDINYSYIPVKEDTLENAYKFSKKQQKLNEKLEHKRLKQIRKWKKSFTNDFAIFLDGKKKNSDLSEQPATNLSVRSRKLNDNYTTNEISFRGEGVFRKIILYRKSELDTNFEQEFAWDSFQIVFEIIKQYGIKSYSEGFWKLVLWTDLTKEQLMKLIVNKIPREIFETIYIKNY